MSVQDKVERVLREFYVLYSRSEPYDKNVEQVIVNKKEALALLEQLKSCMNEMMEEKYKQIWCGNQYYKLAA